VEATPLFLFVHRGERAPAVFPPTGFRNSFSPFGYYSFALLLYPFSARIEKGWPHGLHCIIDWLNNRGTAP